MLDPRTDGFMVEIVNEKETISAAMSILGSRKSPAKAKTARENGKLGGRPKGNSKNRRKQRRATQQP